ncbi:hypothetical protein PWG71_17405 [Nocardiopsis sp. N85]|uniref:hypothetical protein n=1 Tax=Nocardiopsis sp. N85 TaxID=3029400 RepID=UPI00237F9D8C|nr:hypothetical protein [Nocardiopsis sp. N85]MDE3723172.1 hypothetical protein [Nocardiopsis sp. N85]
MDVNQFAFYVFFLVTATVAGNAVLRIRQRGLYDPGQAIENGRMARKQAVSSAALLEKVGIADRKQQIIEALAGDRTASTSAEAIAEEDHGRRELVSLRKRFDELESHVLAEHEHIDREFEEEAARHRQRRRRALSTEIALLVLSVAVMLGLVIAAAPYFA